MAARRYSQFDQRRVKDSGDTPDPGRRGSRATLPKESTAKWAKPPGKVRPRDRSLGMPLVKPFVAGNYMKGNVGLEGVRFPPSLPAQASPRATEALQAVAARVPPVLPSLPTMPTMPVLPATANLNAVNALQGVGNRRRPR